MAVTDWKSPETVVSETYWAISLPWSNTNNAKAEDGNLATNLPFDQGGVWVEQMLSHLVIGGSTSGDLDDTTGKKVTTGLPDISYDSLTWVTVGGSSSLWANSISVSNVNNSGFGFALAYYDTYGYSADLLKCTNFGFSVPSGATITGVEAMVKHDKVLHDSFGMYPRVDCVKLRVYYTESTTPTVGVKYPLPAFKR